MLKARMITVGRILFVTLLLASLSMETLTAAEGPAQQLIIKWREATSAKEQATRTANSLREAGARHGTTLQWLRTMGTGADVYKVTPSLEPGQLDALLQTLGKDPHVEYAEADSMLRTMPRR